MHTANTVTPTIIGLGSELPPPPVFNPALRRAPDAVDMAALVDEHAALIEGRALA